MRLVAALLFFMPAAALAAPFEGVLYVDATIEQVGTVSSQISVRENGDSRVDTKAESVDMQVSMLRRRGQPLVQLLHGQKQWMVLTPKEVGAPEPGATPAPLEIDVKRLGKESISGFATEHVQLREKPSGVVIDLWLTREIEVPDALALVAPEQSNERILDELKRRGLNGYPMKAVTIEAGHTVSVLTAKVERKKLAAETFDVPKTYAKAEPEVAPEPEVKGESRDGRR